MLTGRDRQRGMTLIELMVSMGLGLVVILAATTLFSATVGASSVSTRMTVLRSDLNAIANMIASDVRRSGYTSAATDAFGKAACTSNYETNCPFTFKPSRDLSADGHCIIARMDANDDGVFDSSDTNEVRGYVFDNGTIYFITSWTGTPSCDGTYTRESLSWASDLTVTDLTFTYVSGASGTGIRSIDIAISGTNGTSPDLKMSLTQEVRLRNDDI
ncbi:prepilin-type N-terminal cleavage/methylation domain-containing protein [Gallaecimonas kandeliae]|uniref:prepilin-type N-terminal cleavage/methylation domain-containing protein n=1 Tax=Gallaecimonas kandeliae TaxID=3029055 RepID=UPI00264885DC|nr:prepilin-type N-terminal cleavage/methylation domain-containing protein [Gallaecimonas kandeliae]WKE64951.1 prepilin-type N-terminal cleavage/methylation domain-containing protein [Gallaecimonas kandeliae]